MVNIFPCISLSGGHFENGSITENRGISRNVPFFKWILHLKIYKIGDFEKKNIKTLAPIEFLESALVYIVLRRGLVILRKSVSDYKNKSFIFHSLSHSFKVHTD